MPTYNKLVRDRIPTIIEEDGKQCTVRVLSEQEFHHELRCKLREELDEYLSSCAIAELADMLEVMYALAGMEGVSAHELEELRLAKLAARGGFEKQLFLQTVDDRDHDG